MNIKFINLFQFAFIYFLFNASKYSQHIIYIKNIYFTIFWQPRSYSRYDDDPSPLHLPPLLPPSQHPPSLRLSSSPDVNERTRLTAAAASPATSSRSSRLALEELGVVEQPQGGRALSSGAGGSLRRGCTGRMPGRTATISELDPRRQTTVRLLRSGSPESAC